MVFGRAWSEVFEDLEQGRLMRDPSFLVSLPSQTDPSLAPEGRSAAYVLFPTPNLTSGQVDWDRMRGPYREHDAQHRSRPRAGPASATRSTPRC